MLLWRSGSVFAVNVLLCCRQAIIDTSGYSTVTDGPLDNDHGQQITAGTRSVLQRFPLGDAIVCLDRKHDRVHVTDCIGADLLEAALECPDAESMAERLSQRYAVEHERLIADARQLLTSLSNAVEPEPLDTPVRDFVPDRPLMPVARAVLDHGAGKLCLSMESMAVAEALRHFYADDAYQLKDELSVAERALPAVRVYEHEGQFPVVVEGTTRDTGYTPLQAANCVWREAAAHLVGLADYGVVLHGAAVERQGMSVVLPAAGGSGKSTLCAALLHWGWLLLNDDGVPIDSQGRTVPVTGPLSIKAGSYEVLNDTWPLLMEESTPEFMLDDRYMRYVPVPRGHWSRKPSRCRLVLSPRYQPGLDAAIVESCSAENLFAMLVSQSCLVRRPIPAVDVATLVRFVTQCRAVTVRFGSTEQAVGALEQLWSESVGM